MARAFYRQDVTAYTFSLVSGMRETLGDGTLTIEADDITNDALLDVWEEGITGRMRATFDGEFAAEAGGDNWWTTVGSTGTLVFVSSVGSLTGTFRVVSAQLRQGDALRWSVTLRSVGEVVPS